MGHYANEAIIKLIQKNSSSLCEELNEMAMFIIEIEDDMTTLGLFTRRNKVHLQLIHKKDDIQFVLTMLDFDAESGVEKISFMYNEFDTVGYIDKRRATPKGGKMVFGLNFIDKDKDCNVGDFAKNLLPTMEKVCNSLATAMLAIIKDVLEDEGAGVTLSDFGYINF